MHTSSSYAYAYYESYESYKCTVRALVVVVLPSFSMHNTTTRVVLLLCILLLKVSLASEPLQR